MLCYTLLSQKLFSHYSSAAVNQGDWLEIEEVGEKGRRQDCFKACLGRVRCVDVVDVDVVVVEVEDVAAPLRASFTLHVQLFLVSQCHRVGPGAHSVVVKLRHGG